MNSIKWLIWSNEHHAWWRPDSQGYCESREAAGRYTWEEALEILDHANWGRDAAPNEALIPDIPNRFPEAEPRHVTKKEKKETPEFLPLPAGFKMSEERRASVDNSQLRSFRDWSKAGFKIIKGSKHVARDERGVPLFSSDQVEAAKFPEVDEDEIADEDMQDFPGNPDDYGHN